MCTNCKFINTVLNFANVDEAKCEICQSINQKILEKINEHIKVKTIELKKKPFQSAAQIKSTMEQSAQNVEKI